MARCLPCGDVPVEVRYSGVSIGLCPGSDPRRRIRRDRGPGTDGRHGLVVLRRHLHHRPRPDPDQRRQGTTRRGSAPPWNTRTSISHPLASTYTDAVTPHFQDHPKRMRWLRDGCRAPARHHHIKKSHGKTELLAMPPSTRRRHQIRGQPRGPHQQPLPVPPHCRAHIDGNHSPKENHHDPDPCRRPAASSQQPKRRPPKSASP